MTPLGHHTATGWGSLSSTGQLWCHINTWQTWVSVYATCFLKYLQSCGWSPPAIFMCFCMSTCPPVFLHLVFLLRSYFQVKRDKSCIISILICIAQQTTCVHMSQRSQTALAVRECWFPLQGCRGPRQLINRNKSVGFFMWHEIVVHL